MKIGTSIFWLVIILIAFGYLLSDNRHMRNDLNEALARLQGLNGQVIEAEKKLNSCLQTVQDDQQVISQLRTEIASLYNVMTVKDGEIVSLKALLNQQSSRISELESHPGSAAGEQNTAQTVQSSMTRLQLDPAVVAAIIVLQIVLFIVQRRQRNGYVRLSAEERAQVIRMRRMKKM